MLESSAWWLAMRSFIGLAILPPIRLCLLSRVRMADMERQRRYSVTTSRRTSRSVRKYPDRIGLCPTGGSGEARTRRFDGVDPLISATSRWAIKRLGPDNLAALNGRVTLVRGNHDADPQTMLAAGFAEVCENVVVDVNGKKLWLNHFPPAKTDGADYKGRRGYVRPEPPGPYDMALCGHMHEKSTVERETVNVGVDRWNNRPITLALIFGALDERCALSEITNIGIGAVQ
jgi:calcineurin-like phosphoesterase family protein